MLLIVPCGNNSTLYGTYAYLCTNFLPVPLPPVKGPVRVSSLTIPLDMLIALPRYPCYTVSLWKQRFIGLPFPSRKAVACPVLGPSVRYVMQRGSPPIWPRLATESSASPALLTTSSTVEITTCAGPGRSSASIPPRRYESFSSPARPLSRYRNDRL